MSAYRPNIESLFGNLPVLTGGTRTFEVATITPDEKAAFDEFFNNQLIAMRRVTPAVAEDYKSQYAFFLDVLCIAKARFDNKPLNVAEVAELPRAGQMGVGPILPLDLDGAVSGLAATARNTWDLPAVAGTIEDIIPTAAVAVAAGWHTSAVVESRSMIAIMKNGIIEIDDTPALNQFQWTTLQTSYNPWRATVTVEQTVEKDKSVYQYHTPTAFIITPDLGVRLRAMPFLTKDISPRLVGIVYFEYGYYNVLTWAP